MSPVIRYATAALLLLGSTFSHASIWYSVSSNGYGGNGPTASAAVSDWCSNPQFTCTTQTFKQYAGSTQDEWWTVNTTGGGFSTQTVRAYYNTSPCPTQLPHEWSDGTCNAEQEISCGTESTTKMWSFDPDDPPTSVPLFHSDGACLYSADYSTIEKESCGIYEKGTDIVVSCEIQVTGLGTTGTQADADAQNNGASSSTYDDQGTLTNKQTSKSNDGGQTSYTQSEPINNPDGSTTQTTQETTTNTTGSGTEVWYDDQNIYVRDSTGTTTVYERTKTTTTNTDSTSHEVVETSRTTQTPSTDTTVINGNTGGVTNTPGQGGNTYYDNSVTNNYYDSDGNLTSSETTSDTGTAQEGNPEEEGNCGAPGQPPCEIKLSGEDHLGDPTQAINQSGIITQLDDYISGMESVGSDDIGNVLLDNPFSLPTTGVCNPASYSTEYHGANFNTMSKFCQIYDDHLHDGLSYFFYLLTAIGIFLLHHSTVRRA